MTKAQYHYFLEDRHFLPIPRTVSDRSQVQLTFFVLAFHSRATKVLFPPALKSGVIGVAGCMATFKRSSRWRYQRLRINFRYHVATPRVTSNSKVRSWSGTMPRH